MHCLHILQIFWGIVPLIPFGRHIYHTHLSMPCSPTGRFWRRARTISPPYGGFKALPCIRLCRKPEAGSPWPGEWPPCLPAVDARLAHANECFGEPLIHAQGIALYQIKSPLGEDWVAQCAFTEEGQLQYLTFVKMHEWKPLNGEGENPQIVDPRPSPKLSEIGLSAAGTLAPANGWYEALLPAGHPMQPFYAKSEVRLVYRAQGELFPKLGVTPADDEALVQWAWIREA